MVTGCQREGEILSHYKLSMNSSTRLQINMVGKESPTTIEEVPRFKAPSSPWESFLIGIHKEKSGRYLDPPLSCHTPTGNVCNQERCTVHRF